MKPLEGNGFLKRHGLKLVASALITCGIVFTVRKGGMKFLPEGGDFVHVKPWTVVAYIGSLVGVTWFRSVRWRLLLRPIADVSRRRVVIVSCIGFAAIVLMPFRIGEFVRPYLIRSPGRLGGKSISLTAATSSVVAERVIDGLYVSIVLALALLFVPTVHPLPERVVGLPLAVENVRRSGYGMLVLFGVAFTTIAVFYFARSWAHRTTLAVLGKVSASLAERLATMAEKFADGLHLFSRGREAFWFMVETSAYWMLNALGMWLLAWGSGVVHADGSAPTFGEACAMMGLLSCTILIPGPPGMLGVFQVGIYAAMTMFYPTSMVVGAGAAFVFLLYASQVVCQLLFGAIALWLDWDGVTALEESPIAAE